MNSNKTEPTPNLKRKTKVRIKIRDAGEVMDYEAVAKRSDGDTLKISGFTYCETKECLRQMLRRTLTDRRRVPPEDVEKAVQHIVSYLLASVKSLHANKASAFLNLPVAVGTEVGLELTAYRLDGGEDEEDEEEYVGWYAEVRTTFSGYDGTGDDSFHEFRKELVLGEYLDDAAVKRLAKELLGLTKLAYNVSPAD
jgi:hypothetical protein